MFPCLRFEGFRTFLALKSRSISPNMEFQRNASTPCVSWLLECSFTSTAPKVSATGAPTTCHRIPSSAPTATWRSRAAMGVGPTLARCSPTEVLLDSFVMDLLVRFHDRICENLCQKKFCSQESQIRGSIFIRRSVFPGSSPKLGLATVRLLCYNLLSKFADCNHFVQEYLRSLWNNNLALANTHGV